MSDRPLDDQAVVRYVLGTLPEEERALLEQQFLRDDDAFEHVLAVEDDLLHEYAQGGLSDEDRRRIDERFLRTPEGRERLARAQALLTALRAAQPAPPMRWLPLAAAVLIGAGIAWLAFQRSQSPVQQAVVVPTTSPTAPPSSPPTPASPEVAPTPGRGSVMLALASGALRAGGTLPRATLDAAASTLQLSLTLPAGPVRASYRLALLTPDGDEVWAARGLKADGRSLAAVVPADRLPEGDYEALLSAETTSGPEEVASYSFGVLRP